MREIRKTDTPIEDPVLARLVKQSDCDAHGLRTQVLAYNKEAYAKAKFDGKPDCVIEKGKCNNALDKGNRPKIDPEDKNVHKRKLKRQPPPCPKPGHVKPSHSPEIEMGHRIRICTMSELQEICPEPCLKPAVLPKAKLIYRLGSLAVKIAVAGSLVWCTYGLGLWSDGYRSEELFNNAMKKFFAFERREDYSGGSTCPAAIERGLYEFRDAYNRTAVAVTTFPMKLPYMVWTKRDSDGKPAVKNTSGRMSCHTHELL